MGLAVVVELGESRFTWEQEARRKDAERQWQEYLEMQELNVVMAANKLNEEGMMPVRALKEESNAVHV